MMKIVGLLIILFFASLSLGHAQALTIDFEDTEVSRSFIDFAGAISSVINNPKSGEHNSSSKVARIVRRGGEPWAGSKLVLRDTLDFSKKEAISMKVFTTAPVGTIIKIKLEGYGETYRDVPTTVSNEWETLYWDFTGQPNNFNSIVFMFDFGKVGDGSELSTFLFDDIKQISQGKQIDLPIDFENPDVNYTMTDFGGNYSNLVRDPVDVDNKVIKVVRKNQAGAWAGTTIGTYSGFANNIPLTSTNSKISLRVWSPQVGLLVRMKVENSYDPAQANETEAKTSVANKWEKLEFDFSKQAPGTPSLAEGLKKGWVYNKASIFFNFGTDGVAAGEQVFYFDDVKFEGQNRIQEQIKNYEKKITEAKSKARRNQFISSTIIILLALSFGWYYWNSRRRNKAERKKLSDEIELLKKRLAAQSLAPSGNGKKLVLNKEKIEKAIDAKIGESSWMILNILFRSPSISNKEIAKEVSLSLEGVSSSLRRMYTAFDIKANGNKKVALIMKTMRILFEE